MSGERDLAALLSTMEPELQPGRYVFTTTTRVPETANPVALVRAAPASPECALLSASPYRRRRNALMVCVHSSSRDRSRRRLDLDGTFLCPAQTVRAPDPRPTHPARRSAQRTPAGHRESPPTPLVQVSAPLGVADPARGHGLSPHFRRRPRRRTGSGRSDPSWSSSEADPNLVVPMPATA